MLNLSTDIRVPRLADRLCSFGLTEIVAPLVIGALTSAGVGATTAGAIGAIAAPALIGAGGGALIGAGGELIKGGKPFKGMLTGAGTGAALGAAYGAPGALQGAFPETMASMGLGPTMASMGSDGNWIPGAGGFGTSGASGAAGASQGALGALSDPAWESAMYGSETAVPGAAAGAPVTQAAGFGSSGLGRTLSILGALGQAVTGPPKPNYGVTPGPDTTAATRGPLFDKPLQTSGYLNRSLNPAATDGIDWYHYGETGNHPNFFQNNSLSYPPRMAQGGALSQMYDMGGGPVGGEGSGQDDKIPAALSDGEYVIDASTVSAIGDGSSRAGAEKLDQMRERIAKDKGHSQVVQPKSKKSPLQYLYDKAA